MIEIHKLLGILGLVSIIIGTFMLSINKKIKRKNIYLFLLIGGILLSIYSFYIKDLIFIILQIAYILIVIYNMIRLKIK